MPSKINEVGNKYGRLTVIEESGVNRWGYTMWLCQCECGNTTVVLGANLRRGNVKSCGCLWKLPTGEAAFRQAYNTTRNNAKRRGYQWELTKEQAKDIMTKNCAYCGAEPSQKIGKSHKGIFTYNGIDRVDNSKGYTIDNVVPCCGRCNQAKSYYDLNDFLEWVDRVHLHSRTTDI